MAQMIRKTSLLTLSFLVYIVSSVSNFIISHYKTHVNVLLFPYPIGVCVSYEETYSYEVSEALWGIFTCNVAGDTVTFTPHGTDYNCTSAAGATREYTPSAADYQLHSFECAGEDNYVARDWCSIGVKAPQPEVGDDGKDVCCTGACLPRPQAQATGVCVQLTDGSGLYTMSACDNVSAATNVYGAAGCAEASYVRAATASYIDECSYERRADIFDEFRRMRMCVTAGNDITATALDSYCPYVSNKPTGWTIGAIVGGICVILFILIGVIIYYYLKKKARNNIAATAPMDHHNTELQTAKGAGFEYTNVAPIDNNEILNNNNDTNNVDEEWDGAPKMIFCWCIWRSRSTALLRGINRLSNVKALHEPFVVTYLFGNDPIQKSERYSSEDIDNMQQELDEQVGRIKSYDEIISDLFGLVDYKTNEYDTVWIKQPAFHVYPHILPQRNEKLLTNSTHTFIIRSPEDTIKSLYRITCLGHDESTLINEPKFYESDIGFKELFLMYDLCINKLQTNEPIIIDADDLVNDPENILKKYCNLVGLSFNKSMIDWSNEDKSGEKPWHFVPNAWIKELDNSTAFYKGNLTEDKYEDITYPDYIYDFIDKNQPYYQALFDKRLSVDS